MSDEAVEPSAAALRLEFDGEEYAGTIGAAELGQALVSLRDYVQAVAGSGGMSEVSRPEVRVAAFEDGSFDVQLLIQALLPGGVAAGIAAGIGSTIRFYWKNMRRVVVKHEHDAERGVHVVTMASGEVMDWTEDEWRLFNNRRAKRALRGVVAPLSRGATIRVITSTGTEEIPAGDAYRFEAPDDGPEDEVQRFETWVTPDTVSFDPEKKWRLASTQLGRSFAATIEDRDFVQGVAAGRVRVGKNDTFRLAIRTVTRSDQDGPKQPAYFIERVLEHHQGESQDALDETEE